MATQNDYSEIFTPDAKVMLVDFSTFTPTVSGDTTHAINCTATRSVNDDGTVTLSTNNIRAIDGDICGTVFARPVTRYRYSDSSLEGLVLFDHCTNVVALIRTEVIGGTIKLVNKPWPNLPTKLYIDEHSRIENPVFIGFDEIIYFEGDFDDISLDIYGLDLNASIPEPPN